MRHPCLVLTVVLAALTGTAPAAAQVLTARASESSTAVEGNSISRNVRISGNGDFVGFYGSSTNLVPGDTNGFDDVFLKDTQTGVLRRVSVPTGGLPQGNASSLNLDLSAGGDVVVFESFATNLVPGDTNFRGDIFWHHVASQTTEIASISTGTALGNGHSSFPACDDSGEVIAFESSSTNLAGADANGVQDIYLRFRTTGTTERISLTQGGVEPNGECRGPAVSPDGRWVGFHSYATNLIPNDTNGVTDVFLKDRVSGALTRISVGTGGVQGNGQSRYAALSFDARFIAFSSESNNWIPGTTVFFDTYVHERATGVTTLASRHSDGTPSNSASLQPDISRDGRYVTFWSYADNLVPQDANGLPDVFLHDTQGGATLRISTGPIGVEANGLCALPALSGDGLRAAFESDATNLVAADGNGQRDAFYVDWCVEFPSVYCTAKVNSLGCTPAISSSGIPSASAGSGYLVTASNVLNNKNGLFFYGTSGQAGLPFQGGYLCVKAPIVRTDLQLSGGNPPPNDCSGSYALDFNAYIAGGADADLLAGASVDGQYWARDPGFAPPANTSLTGGIHFTICP